MADDDRTPQRPDEGPTPLIDVLSEMVAQLARAAFAVEAIGAHLRVLIQLQADRRR